MKVLLLLIITVFSVSSFADDENTIHQTSFKKISSFSVEGVFFELEGLKVKYYDEDDRKRTVSALIDATADQAALLLLAKANKWKVSIIYDAYDTTENYDDEECLGFKGYNFKGSEEDETICYTIEPSEIIIQ